MNRGAFLVIVGAVLATAAASQAWAHPGHEHKVMGTVSVLHDNHLEVQDAKGQTTTVMLDAKTKIRRGRTVLKADAIKVGDRVVVTAAEVKDKDGKTMLMAKDVQLGAATTTAAKKHQG